MSRITLLVPVALLAGCYHGPDWRPLPEQRATVKASEAGLAMYVAMRDPDAPKHLVRDVNMALEDNLYRWARRRPEMQFGLEGVRHLKLVLSFHLPEATMKFTGPVTLTFFINGQRFDAARYEKPGLYRYEKEAPPELLKANANNVVRIEPDPVWVSPDGLPMGFVLTEAGFQY